MTRCLQELELCAHKKNRIECNFIRWSQLANKLFDLSKEPRGIIGTTIKSSLYNKLEALFAKPIFVKQIILTQKNPSVFSLWTIKANLFFFIIFQVKLNVLDKNDSPPVFRDEPIVFTVSEDLSPGHSVGTIKATDPDTIGSLSFALIGGDDKKFTLDQNSGILKLIDTLDRETKEIYELNVRVSDGVQNTDTIVSVQVSVIFNENEHSSKIQYLFKWMKKNEQKQKARDKC